jgi:PTH1 family peptidyl-tRNA hydrolase
MKLIVGLGNPGEKYAGNRHNIGFMAVDEMARGYSFGAWKKRFQGLAAEGLIGAEKCILLKPGTYMNESGRSVGEAARFYKLSAGDVIIIHDELDLKPGTVRVKTGGGNAGHNGLKSISAHIGNDYTRVRLGIGHPGDKALVTNYVLQDFAKADKQWLDSFLEGIARGMARLAEGGEAAFLSEAARGRAVSPAAAKLNGATAPEGKIEAAAPKIEAVPAQEKATVSAASRPIEAMPAVQVPVFASREAGGGAAVSRAVIMPEPDRRAPIAAEVAPQIPAAAKSGVAPVLEPAPAARIEPAPALSPKVELEQAQPEPEPAAAPVLEPLPAARIEPSPAKVEYEQVLEPAAPAPKIEPTPSARVELAPAPAQKAPAKAAKVQPAPAEKKKRMGFFTWWFRKRIRGGAPY